MGRLTARLKAALRPLRTAAGRLVIPAEPLTGGIFYKAAEILSSELVEGDFLEFGVFRGSTFVQAFNVFQRSYQERQADRTRIHAPEFRRRLGEIWQNMRFFAFDSFQGLPQLTGCDQETSDFSLGKYAATEEEFVAQLKARAVSLDKVVIVSGWFSETCNERTRTEHHMRSAAIVHIDCDLYESTRTVLEFVGPLIVDGTILVFDDWFSFRGNPNLGEQRAFGEWRKTRPDLLFTEYQKEGPWRNSFIVNRVD